MTRILAAAKIGRSNSTHAPIRHALLIGYAKTVFPIPVEPIRDGYSVSNRKLLVAPPNRSASLLGALLAFASVWNVLSVEVVKLRGLLPDATFYAGDVAVIFAIALSFARRDGHSSARGHKPRMVLLLILIAGIISGVVAGVTPTTSILGMRWLMYAYCGLRLACLDAATRARAQTVFAKALIWSMVLVEVPYGLYQVLTRVPLPAPEYIGEVGGSLGTAVRAFGTLGWPTTLGDSLVLPLCMALVLLRGRKRAWVVALLALLELLTFSRGSIAAGIAAGLLLLIQRKKQEGKRYPHINLLFATGGAALLAVLASGGLGIAGRANDLSSANFNRGIEAGGRLGIIKLGWQLLRTHLWFGTGPGSFGGGISLPTSSYINDLAGARLLTAESSALQIVVELGVVGAGLVAVLFILILRGLRQTAPGGPLGGYRTLGMASLLIFAIASLSSVVLLLRPVALPLWIVVGLAMRGVAPVDAEALNT